MDIYINESTNQTISDYRFDSPVDSYSFKRGDYEPIRVYFVRNNVIQAPDAGRTIIFACKEKGNYDSDSFIVYGDVDGIGDNYYQLFASFDNETVDSFLANDTPSITLMGEITWSDDSVNWESTNVFDVVVNNDVIKNNEGYPISSSGASADWLAKNKVTPVYVSAPPVNGIVSQRTVELAGTGNVTTNFKTIFSGGSALSATLLPRPTTGYTEQLASVASTTTVNGNLYTIRYATRQNYQLTGGGEANGNYVYSGYINNFPAWIGPSSIVISYSPTQSVWRIGTEVDTLYISEVVSSVAPKWPEECTWFVGVDGSTPIPIVANKSATAAQLVYDLNYNVPVFSTSLSATCMDAGDGYVANTATFRLTGGVVGTPGGFGQLAINLTANKIYVNARYPVYKWYELTSTVI